MDTQVIKCPKCHSTNLHVDKKGFSGGKALAGVITFGMIGALAGTIGSNNIEITCLNCGNKFNPIKEAKREQQDRAIQDMSENNPFGLSILLLGVVLAILLLFAPGVSIWWSIAIFIAAIIIPVFTGKK